MGIYCEHSYAHTTDGHNDQLPQVLKGRDAIALRVFQELGCTVRVCPVLKRLWCDEHDQSEGPSFQRVVTGFPKMRQAEYIEADDQPLTEVITVYPIRWEVADGA